MRVDIGDWLYYKKGLDFRGDLTGAAQLGRSDAKRLLRASEQRALYIRNVYDFDCGEPTRFWYEARDRVVQLEDYKASHRGNVRKSLKKYRFARVSMDEMRSIGYRVFCENWERFPKENRPRLESEAEFEQYLVEQERRGVEFWVGYAQESGEAAMWVSVYVVGCIAYFERIRLSIKHMRSSPTYALHHEVSNYYISERGVRYVIGGARTATSHSNTQDLLEGTLMYRRVYCRFQLWVRFPYNIGVQVLLPFRKFMPQTSKMKALLALKSFES